MNQLEMLEHHQIPSLRQIVFITRLFDIQLARAHTQTSTRSAPAFFNILANS
jgi:hypothetical protein